MDRISAMRLYVAVVESGSFARAAEQLRISTTSASRRLAELENHLGARLLQRTTRRIAMTEAGSAYFDRCRRILSDIEEAECLAAGADASPGGLLRISLPQSFGLRYVAPGLPGFCSKYPELELDVSFSDRVVEFVEEGVDVAIRISAALKESLVAKKIVTLPIVACASRSYFEKMGRPNSVKDLAVHHCLQYSYAPIGRFLEDARVASRFRTNSGDMIRIAALAGQGIAFLPVFLVHEDLACGALERILEDCTFPELGVYAVYLETARHSARVRAFVDYFSAMLAGNAPWK